MLILLSEIVSSSYSCSFKLPIESGVIRDASEGLEINSGVLNVVYVFFSFSILRK